MYTGHRISVPDKSDYCNDGGAGGMRPRSFRRIARPPRSRPARQDTSCCVLAVHIHAPGRRALHCLQDLNRCCGGLPKRTRSLLDLSRLLQCKKQKAHQAAAALSKLRRFSIMIMQPLRIGLTHSTSASLPFRSIGKSAKAVFAFLSPSPRATTVPFHSVMALAGEKASAPPSLHFTIVAIADRVGSVTYNHVAQQVRNSRRAHQLSDFYVRGSASKSFFTGAIYLVGLSPSSLLSCFLQLEKARSPPAVKKSVGAALIAAAMRSSGFLSPDGSGQG